MLTTADSARSQPVVLVNESFGRRFFPGEDPIGRRVTFGNPTDADTRWQTIVGVVADTKRGGFEREPWAATYFPLRHAPTGRLVVFLRTAGDPVALAAAAQRAVWALDPNQAVASVRTVDEMLAQEDANRRFTRCCSVSSLASRCSSRRSACTAYWRTRPRSAPRRPGSGWRSAPTGEWCFG